MRCNTSKSGRSLEMFWDIINTQHSGFLIFAVVWKWLSIKQLPPGPPLLAGYRLNHRQVLVLKLRSPDYALFFQQDTFQEVVLYGGSGQKKYLDYVSGHLCF